MAIDNRWRFVSTGAKAPLPIIETNYWKKLLSKILKVGMEFEYNLPTKHGSCNGKNQMCRCVKSDTGCWEECINRVSCDKKDRTTCRKGDRADSLTIKCTKDTCEGCTDYIFECFGMYCTHFMSNCLICKDFSLNCDKCGNLYDSKKDPEYIRDEISRLLHPTNTYAVINDSGVHSITVDGSLQDKQGVEIITVGRRIDFWEFYNMAKKIIDVAVSHGAYLNERCSTHMHVLASYYGKLNEASDNNGIPSKVSELEKPMPQIILANLHQLIRKYQNAITWMTMGLNEPTNMTRWEKFRVSVLEISAILNSMPTVASMVESNSGDNKYGWINYRYTQFDDESDITRFHIEYRVMDGMQSPSVVAAIACLYYSLVIKAVEISRYGLIEVGDEKWLKKAKTVKKAILNNMKGYQDGDRFGDTSTLSKYFTILTEESLDLVTQLKHILMAVGPAYQILEELAIQPVALRR